MWFLIIISLVTGEKIIEEGMFISEIVCEKRLSKFKGFDIVKYKSICVRVLNKDMSPPVGSRAGV